MKVAKAGGDLRRCYTSHHPFSWGIDEHARNMYVWIWSHAGERGLHRYLKAAPAPLLKAVAPYRDGLVVAVEGLFTCSWLADLCAHAGLPFGLDHALSMTAIHGGNVPNDTIDAHQIAALLRGGRLPQASVDPAQRRATRDLLRRRTQLRRPRAALFSQVPHPQSQSNLPESGQNLASQANREGGAERFADPAVPQTLAVDVALLTSEANRLPARARSSVKPAK
jgi:transposase